MSLFFLVPLLFGAFFWTWWVPFVFITMPTAIGSRAYRMGILGMWVPDRKRQGQRELFEADGAKRSPGRELALPEDKPPVYELYDHPAPPIPLLGASLPTAPLGYGWEIHVIPNDEGNPALRLAMLDLATSTVIDAIEGDLIIVRRWKYANDDTYASFYRRAKAQCAKESELMGKVMMANLITPMVDWARLITLRYIVNNPDETKCNYMLLENMEEASA